MALLNDSVFFFVTQVPTESYPMIMALNGFGVTFPKAAADLCLHSNYSYLLLVFVIVYGFCDEKNIPFPSVF